MLSLFECEETYQILRLFDYDLAHFNTQGKVCLQKH